MSPMCQYSSTDGYANDWHLVHLGSRAVGGVALIIMEATAVSPEGRISPGDLGIWSDAHVSQLRRIVDFIHAEGSIAGIQLAHAGRKASHQVPWEGGAQLDMDEGGWQTVAPSAIPFSDTEVPPIELSKEGINKITHDFLEATKRAKAAGFKVMEIHAAHGYLLHEFLSPLSNHRTDAYGGSFNNRIRLLLEVTETVKSVWPDNLPLFVRISSTDWTEGGWSIQDSVELATILKNMGVDLIDCSSGGNVSTAQIPLSPGYQVPFAEAIRTTGILTGAVGLITSISQAEEILEKQQADMIFFGRELLRNPYLALDGTNTTWPLQYLRAKRNV